jgi:hypothetical protein
MYVDRVHILEHSIQAMVVWISLQHPSNPVHHLRFLVHQVPEKRWSRNQTKPFQILLFRDPFLLPSHDLGYYLLLNSVPTRRLHHLR